MLKRSANLGGRNKDTVYRFLRELIREGEHAGDSERRVAWFVNEEGRFRIKWDIAVERYIEYRVKKNPQFNKDINRRKASNTFRGALLNYYKKDGAKEYQDCKKVNGKNEVIEREFQIPHAVFRSLFGSIAEISDPKEHGTSDGSVYVSTETNDYSCVTPFLNDTGFDELHDKDFYDAVEDFTSDFDPHEVISKSDGNLQGGLFCDDNGFGETYLDMGESSYGLFGTEDPFLNEGQALFSNTQTLSGVQYANNQETLNCDKQACGDSVEEQLHDSGLDMEIKSSSSDDIEMHFNQGGVHDICPPSGSVKGGLKFQINLKENLPEDVKSGIACFDGIGDVELDVTNPYSFSGITLASPKCGPVPVTVQTRDGHQLGMTQFVYVDEVQEVLNQLIKEPALRSLYPDHMQALLKEVVRDLDLQLSLITAMSCQEDESDSYVAQNPEAKLAQVQVQVLQLLVYVAAEEDAEQFIQMIFSTSAGKMVFDSYKAETTLPEDVARANGHSELAKYLQDVNKRLSMWNGIDVHSKSVDWQELIQAVKRIQTQSSMSEDEKYLRGMPSDEDSNLSDYFADTETSSCGSLEVDTEWLNWEGTLTGDKDTKRGEDQFSIDSGELFPKEETQFDQAEDEEETSHSSLISLSLLTERLPEPSFEEPTLFDQGTRSWPFLSFLSDTFWTLTRDKDTKGEEDAFSIDSSELFPKEETQFDQAEDEEETSHSSLILLSALTERFRTLTEDKDTEGEEDPVSIDWSELFLKEETQFDQAEDEEETSHSSLISLSPLTERFPEPSLEEATRFDQGTRSWPSLSFLSGTFCIFSSSSSTPHHKGSRVTNVVFAASMLTVVAVFQLGGCTLDGRTPSEIFIETIWHYEVSTTSNFSQWECKAVEIFCRLSQPRMLTLNPIQGGKPINLDDGMCYPADLISTCFYEVNDTNIVCLLGCVLSFIGVVVGLFWKRLHTYLCPLYAFEGRQTKSPEIVQPILPDSIVEDVPIIHVSIVNVPNRHLDVFILDAPNKEIKELDTGRKSERDKPTATLIKWKQKNGVDATSGNLVNKLKSTSP